MRSTTLSATAFLISAVGLAQAQTSTDCNPMERSDCPLNPALAGTQTTDFTKESPDWALAAGTTLKYGPDGAEFTISQAGNAPTISSTKYIMFGKVEAMIKASPGTGTVSSFILESDDLDEIDWEWLGSDDTQVQTNFYGKGNTTTYDRGGKHPVQDPVGTFHKYTIDWTKDYIRWSIDDHQVREVLYGDALALGGANFPQTPMRVKAGSWIGCVDAAAAADPKTQGTCSWAGGPIDFSKGPFTMYMKDVTIQDNSKAANYIYCDRTGSYQSIKADSCDGASVVDGSAPPAGGSPPAPAPSAGSPPPANPSEAASPSAPAAPGSSPAPGSPAAPGAPGAPATTPAPGAAVLAEVTASVGSNATATASTNGTATTMSKHTSSTGATVSKTPSPETNAAAEKHKMGALDYAVMVFGLGLGYLVM